MFLLFLSFHNFDVGQRFAQTGPDILPVVDILIDGVPFRTRLIVLDAQPDLSAFRIHVFDDGRYRIAESE